MAELSPRESKLVQYLNEAYGKEKELETALTAHIGMTTRAPYKKRLREHLSETKRHARELEKRVKKLGGTAQQVPIEGLDPVAKGAGAAVGIAGRAVAAAQGPLHAIRGTGEQEKMLKNAKSEYSDEHEEIATYTAIEVLADALGDRDTAKLARSIRREEESMARFLERQIPILTKAVVQAEIPAQQRGNGAASRRRPSAKASSGSRANGGSGAKASGGGRAKASGGSGAKASGGSGAKASGGGSRAKASGGSRANGGSRAKAARSPA